MDTLDIERRLGAPIEGKPINALVKVTPATDKQKKLIEAAVFQLSPSVEPILPKLVHIQDSNTFQKFWQWNGKQVARSLMNHRTITVDDVAVKIWQPTWYKLGEIREDLCTLNITVLQMNRLFKDFDRSDELRRELLLLNGQQEEPWIDECSRKMQLHRRLGEFRTGAKAVINAAELLKWKGDLTLLHAIVDMVCCLINRSYLQRVTFSHSAKICPTYGP